MVSMKSENPHMWLYNPPFCMAHMGMGPDCQNQMTLSWSHHAEIMTMLRNLHISTLFKNPDMVWYG